MSYYLSKYKGIYRLKADIDENTNDFPRDLNGKIEENDVYIQCKKGRIYHYGRSTLVCYCDKLGAGRNILKSIANDLNISVDTCTTETSNGLLYDYNKFYEILEQSKLLFNIEETDQEVLWRFKDKDISLMVKYMQPLTSGAGISPFSTRNLPKQKYEISKDEMKEYEEIRKHIPEDDLLSIGRYTQRFISEIMSKDKRYRGKAMSQVMKKKMLKGKEFIHSEGFWDKYMKYLRKNIEER